MLIDPANVELISSNMIRVLYVLVLLHSLYEHYLNKIRIILNTVSRLYVIKKKKKITIFYYK